MIVSAQKQQNASFPIRLPNQKSLSSQRHLIIEYEIDITSSSSTQLNNIQSTTISSTSRRKQGLKLEQELAAAMCALANCKQGGGCIYVVGRCQQGIISGLKKFTPKDRDEFQNTFNNALKLIKPNIPTDNNEYNFVEREQMIISISVKTVKEKTKFYYLESKHQNTRKIIQQFYRLKKRNAVLPKQGDKDNDFYYEVVKIEQQAIYKRMFNCAKTRIKQKQESTQKQFIAQNQYLPYNCAKISQQEEIIEPFLKNLQKKRIQSQKYHILTLPNNQQTFFEPSSQNIMMLQFIKGHSNKFKKQLTGCMFILGSFSSEGVIYVVGEFEKFEKSRENVVKKGICKFSPNDKKMFWEELKNAIKSMKLLQIQIKDIENVPVCEKYKQNQIRYIPGQFIIKIFLKFAPKFTNFQQSKQKTNKNDIKIEEKAKHNKKQFFPKPYPKSAIETHLYNLSQIELSEFYKFCSKNRPLYQTIYRVLIQELSEEKCQLQTLIINLKEKGFQIPFEQFQENYNKQCNGFKTLCFIILEKNLNYPIVGQDIQRELKRDFADETKYRVHFVKFNKQTSHSRQVISSMKQSQLEYLRSSCLNQSQLEYLQSFLEEIFQNPPKLSGKEAKFTALRGEKIFTNIIVDVKESSLASLEFVFFIITLRQPPLSFQDQRMI